MGAGIAQAVALGGYEVRLFDAVEARDLRPQQQARLGREEHLDVHHRRARVVAGVTRRVQVDGEAEVLHLPEAEDALVDYYRCIAGEHPDWDEYRAAMRLQGKALIRITPTRWGPIATGGFPADVAARLDA